MINQLKCGLSEPTLFLVKLYEAEIAGLISKNKNNKHFFSFIEDPDSFDYEHFDENWWPLFRFSDIGMRAMKNGRDRVIEAFKRLKGKDKKEADHYVDLYSKKEEPIDNDDIYHIPDDVNNPGV
ncbi:MAG: hypothetical protein K6G42_08360 [Lachnospiraceae bacterium]|nr:hypothetical protein [Lachnospiraceae bacterium]